MKKTLTAIAMAACLAMSPIAAFAEETEATDSAVTSLQGMDDQNNIWTVALDAAGGNAAVCLQIPDENGEYPEENYVVVYGPMEVGEDYLTITDSEDGMDYTFGMQSVEGTTNQVEMTYEPTESTVVLSLIDESTVESDENMTYYAGFDESGAQWTVGFDWDNSLIAINVMTDAGENTVAGAFEDDGEGTLTITGEDGSVSTLYYEPANEDWTALTLTDEDGISITVTYINPSILSDVAA